MVLDNLPEITTPKELATFLKVSEQTVKRAIKSGGLRAFKIARDWRIERNSVLEWIEKGR
ncbi:DNA-binding protein, excisionase family [Candidatus Desulfosporosinus infrequens]|uniref:DNA-binding protein, excisionase family n=1 Tax=Candidatus Desulfosporosinus infrequens TaxID=2043169 RepID=A0A2U3LGZ4_9FIRM|nr:DNA-binding protein, excisionase family [Candidatus Desulfosporosinus infrequens]